MKYAVKNKSEKFLILKSKQGEQKHLGKGAMVSLSEDESKAFGASLKSFAHYLEVKKQKNEPAPKPIAKAAPKLEEKKEEVKAVEAQPKKAEEVKRPVQLKKRPVRKKNK